jgi:hypothetical protein
VRRSHVLEWGEKVTRRVTRANLCPVVRP